MIIKKGQCPSSLFLSNVNECVSTRESNEYVEGLNSEVRLELYITFDKVVMYLLGTNLVMSKLGSCLNSGQEHMV